MNTLSKFFAAALVVVASFSVYAEKANFSAQSFEDQHGNSLQLTAQTQYVIFTSDKDSGEQVKQLFNELNLTDLASENILYVADVSAMPSLITKMFALPKMRDYAFNMAVVMDEEKVADWPRQENKITAIKIDNFAVTNVDYLATSAEIKTWLGK